MSHEEGTAGALIQFLEYLADKGLMNKSTATARKSACTKVMGIDDDWEAIDIRTLDVDRQASRFHTLRKSKYKPDSLSAYESRFRSAVAEYLNWLEDPSSFKPTTASRKRRPNDTGEPLVGQDIGPPDPRPSPVQATPSTGDGRSTLPTLVVGLIEQFPEDGHRWDDDDLQRWIQLAEVVLRTVYVDSGSLGSGPADS